MVSIKTLMCVSAVLAVQIGESFGKSARMCSIDGRYVPCPSWWPNIYENGNKRGDTAKEKPFRGTDIKQPLNALQQEFLNAHNQFRALENATDMMELVWDTNLEKMAAHSAFLCVNKHSYRSYLTDKYGYDFIGENVYRTSKSRFNATRAIEAFYEEKANYNSTTGLCAAGKKCGHYTQVVWSKTCSVGCAVYKCDEYHHVYCNYGPAGNRIGKKPYRKGTHCSECPKGSTCDGYLCRGTCSGRI